MYYTSSCTCTLQGRDKYMYCISSYSRKKFTPNVSLECNQEPKICWDCDSTNLNCVLYCMTKVKTEITFRASVICS